ncbi:histidine kinase dimerization/phospho-acceptor domain-containing protein [Algoriphagus boritolerans]|uniref:histidine kinase dimerization/phospho-acceptor domain-containing protein n=1 Tax=Algoriphagus boritolerans TaxID=308111 RepID=UPI002FCE2253
MAHEVKNPLTTIVLSADQLQTELPKESLTESGDLIEVIRRNCDRINTWSHSCLTVPDFLSLIYRITLSKNCWMKPWIR